MTGDQFLELLGQYVSVLTTDQISSLSALQRYGRKKGWLEEQDVLAGGFPLEKRALARILHQFLRSELHEEETVSWEEAMELKDIFDCRSCVNHVAQMYIKGIMTARPEEKAGLVFGMQDVVSEVEGKRILERAFQPELRIQWKEISRTENSAEKAVPQQITKRQAADLLEQQSGILIDVREVRAFEDWHLEKARNVPLSAILANPESVIEDKDELVLFYCEEGIQSQIAAECLRDHGYHNVYSFKAGRMD